MEIKGQAAAGNRNEHIEEGSRGDQAIYIALGMKRLGQQRSILEVMKERRETWRMKIWRRGES